MPIKIFKVHENNPESRTIRQMSDILDRGGVVLIPTETGFCFVGDAASEETHRRFLKLRDAHPARKPFSLLCRDIAQVSGCSILNTSVFRVAARIFPGPYTLILECSRGTPKVAAGPKRRQVGIRVPSHPVARAVVECYGRPLLVTSVTDADELMEFFEGHEEESVAWWTTAEGIVRHFRGDFEAALDCQTQVPLRGSTVIDFTQHPAVIVRDGGWDTDVLGLIS